MTGSAAPALAVRADVARCCGAGHCVRIAPQVFDQDERDGTVIVLQPHPPASLAPVVREAAAVCPTNAIAVGPGAWA
jgi:ferredoxin